MVLACHSDGHRSKTGNFLMCTLFHDVLRLPPACARLRPSVVVAKKIDLGKRGAFWTIGRCAVFRAQHIVEKCALAVRSSIEASGRCHR